MNDRDEFAKAALIGGLSSEGIGSNQMWSSHEAVAEWAYKIADAMLAEREKTNASGEVNEP